MNLERDFQKKLIRDIEKILPGCMIIKNDPSYIQGIPDLTILYGEKWGTLECKKDEKASHQPNQDYYVGRMNEMSFSRFVYPENKEEVLHDLEQAFKSERATCSIRRK